MKCGIIGRDLSCYFRKKCSLMSKSPKLKFKMPRSKEEWLKLVLAFLLLAVIGNFLPNGTKPQFDNQNVRTEQKMTSSSQNVQHQEKIPVQFIRVVDGDTIIVRWQNKERRVRYLMVDTPESVKEGLKPQPFGKDSSKRNEELLKNAKQVYMMFDKGPKEDDYERLLAYVYADDVLVAEQLLKEGLASVSYVNPPNNSLEQEFRSAQKVAQKAKLNIWSIEGYVNSKGKFKIQE